MPPKSAELRHYSLSRQNSVKFCKDLTQDRIFFAWILFACSNVFASLNTMHCKALQCTAMHYNALQRTATHCNSLQFTKMHYNALQCPAMHYNALQCTEMHYNALQWTAMHCNTLQYTAMHCNTLQYTAMHCNALQRATKQCAHCNAVQYTAMHCTYTAMRYMSKWTVWSALHSFTLGCRCHTWPVHRYCWLNHSPIPQQGGGGYYYLLRKLYIFIQITDQIKKLSA